ncbi:MAG: 50S ribosomal protein L7 [Oscillospiraceae bacterium]|nr:50S ribosomal protein L7 [Oscillospiraceae bacterium]
MRDVLGLLGLALRAGRLEVGEDLAGEACRFRRCRLLVTARDAAENTRRKAEYFAQEGQCLLLELPCSKAELGAALGRASCAMAAVTDLGFAQAAAERLAREEPEKYAQIAEKLSVKGKRAAERKKKKAKVKA